ncbi:ATP synthase subunit b', chloroplastic [Sesamum alatum]|uniref:ATP synthase subunit b', chloroplastic n=1 Tax=Sesamum alatum TaxID=300844 RepID=A0AAE1YBK4_9LAMI|nr:ATP synthase subunit b', chloroplastic [Sesamum alatum]
MDERDTAIRDKSNNVKDTPIEVKQLEEQAAAMMKALRAEISAALNKMKMRLKLRWSRSWRSEERRADGPNFIRPNITNHLHALPAPAGLFYLFRSIIVAPVITETAIYFPTAAVCVAAPSPAPGAAALSPAPRVSSSFVGSGASELLRRLPNNSFSEMLEKVRSLPEFVASSGRVFWFWFFLLGGSLSFVSFLYAAVISKLLPPSDNVVIPAIQNDWYYCFVVPLTLPILIVAVYFHWLSMKLFKHA